MKNNKIIKKYHNRLSTELGCHQTPRFKIGEVVEVRKNVEDIHHSLSSYSRWVIWDSFRKELEGKRAEIIDIDYTDDDTSKDKAGCIGYRINVEGRRSDIAVHEEALKKIWVKPQIISRKVFFDTLTKIIEYLNETPIPKEIDINNTFRKELKLCIDNQKIIIDFEEEY